LRVSDNKLITMKIFLLLLILLFFIGTGFELKADDTYPVSYSKLEYHQGGELVIARSFTKDTSILSYFIKPNWTEEADVFYVWKGVPRSNVKSFAIGSAYILVHFLSKRQSLWFGKKTTGCLLLTLILISQCFLLRKSMETGCLFAD